MAQELLTAHHAGDTMALEKLVGMLAKPEHVILHVLQANNICKLIQGHVLVLVHQVILKILLKRRRSDIITFSCPSHSPSTPLLPRRLRPLPPPLLKEKFPLLKKFL